MSDNIDHTIKTGFWIDISKYEKLCLIALQADPNAYKFIENPSQAVKVFAVQQNPEAVLDMWFIDDETLRTAVSYEPDLVRKMANPPIWLIEYANIVNQYKDG